MLSFIADLLKEEMKRHPHMFALMLLLSAALMGYSYRVFAQQAVVNTQFESLQVAQQERTTEVNERFRELEARIGQVERNIDQRFYEQRLANVETEIFQLERITSSTAATERDHARLGNLRIERGEIVRKLDEVARGIYR
jgi:uncharacterized protein HemX